MALIDVQDLSIRFPIYGADHRSFKRQIKGVVGGAIGRSGAVGPTMVEALSGVSFRLKAGDRLGLIGHNGAGKTTLLRALSGAYEPDDGQIEVQGRIAALLDLSL